MNQKKTEHLQTISYSDRERMSHMSWCNANGIVIYPKVIDNYSLRIIIETNGKKIVGEKIYKNWGAKMSKTDEKWWDVIYKLYTYKFLKLGGVSCKEFEVELEVFLIKQKKKVNLKQ